METDGVTRVWLDAPDCVKELFPVPEGDGRGLLGDDAADVREHTDVIYSLEVRPANGNGVVAWLEAALIQTGRMAQRTFRVGNVDPAASPEALAGLIAPIAEGHANRRGLTIVTTHPTHN